MRLGLLADVHANLPALQAVLTSLQHDGVDELLVAGDLVGYGARPDECVRALLEAGAHCVRGNHDLLVLGLLPQTRFPLLARRSAAWTQSVMSPDVREALRALPDRLVRDTVLVTHGSLDSPEEYVLDAQRGGELLARLPNEAPTARTLVLGHTHLPWCLVQDQGVLPARGLLSLGPQPRLLNPGSVGQSRQRERRPLARYAVLDTVASSVTYASVDYDVEAARSQLQRIGMPDRCLHAPPSTLRRWGGQLRRRLRQGSAGAG